MRILPPQFRRFARRIALLGGLVFVGIAYVGPWVQERLSERIGHIARNDSANGPAAYKTLLALDDSALGVLVKNAVASDPAIAETARDALAVRVDTWRARNATGGSFRIALHVQRLLAELEKQTPEMTYSGKAWANRFANHLLATVSLVPIKKRGSLIASVDHLINTMATTPTLSDPPTRPQAIVVTAPVPTPVAEPSPVADPSPVAEPSPVSIPTEAIATVVESIPPPSASEALVENDPFEQDANEPTEDPWKPAWRDNQAATLAPHQPQPIDPQPYEPQPLVTAPAKPLPDSPNDYANSTDLQLLAALLENELALRASQQPQAVGPTSKATPVDPQLTARLESLGYALQSRGYRGVSITHVRLLLSNRISDRLQLVEQLLVDRTGDTARLLLLLAHDVAADVRVAAITALGSSPRKELVEAAWALALRDKDARVARIAEQIQARRQ